VKITRSQATVIVPDSTTWCFPSNSVLGNDLDAIEAIHRRQPLVLRTLVQRFESN